MRGEGHLPVDLSDQQPVVHYESPNGEFQSCSLEEAQLWFRSGFFTSETRFIFAPRGANVRSGEWRVWTLGELIELNGRSIPFLMSDEERRRREVETMRVMSEELADLDKRRLSVVASMQPLHTRLVAAHAEMLQIEQRIDSSLASITYDDNLEPDQSINSSPAEYRLDGRPECTIPPSEDTLEEVIESGKNVEIHIEHSIDIPSLGNLESDPSPSPTAFDEREKTIVSKDAECVTVSPLHELSTQPLPLMNIAIPLMSIPESDIVQIVDAATTKVDSIEMNVESLLIRLEEEEELIEKDQIENVDTEKTRDDPLEKKVDIELIRLGEEEKRLEKEQIEEEANIDTKKTRDDVLEKDMESELNRLEEEEERLQITTKTEYPPPQINALPSQSIDSSLRLYSCDEFPALPLSIQQKPLMSISPVSVSGQISPLKKKDIDQKRETERLRREKEEKEEKEKRKNEKKEEAKNEKREKKKNKTAAPLLSNEEKLSFNISNMPNPFDEIVHPFDADFVKELTLRTSVGRILRFEQNRVFPLFGVDPFDVLCLFPSSIGGEADVVTPYAMKLRQLSKNRHDNRYLSLVSHLFVEKEFRCVICRTLIPIDRAVLGLIEHIMGGYHLKKMKQQKSVYPLEALAFWMLALRIARRPSVSKYLTAPPSIPSPSAEFSFPPTSPLSVLSYHRNVPNPCMNVRLVTSFMERKLAPAGGVSTRLRCDEQLQRIMGTSVHCEVCLPTNDVVKKKNVLKPSRSSVEFSCPFQLITHLNSPDHLDAILDKDGQVDMDAIFFWLDAMARASDDKHEATHPRSPLNRQLIAGEADPTSPIAPLVHFEKVPHPCPDYGDAMAFLKKKMRKCDVVKFNEAMQPYFEETILCGVCIEYDRIRSGSDFIAHITTSKHTENATLNGGLVSKKALRFWLDALCEAGAVVRSKDTNEVWKLFGEQ